MRPRDFHCRGSSARINRRPGPRGSAAAAAALFVIATVAITTVVAIPIPPAAAVHGATTTTPIPHIIIDTDLSLYWDDATAIGIANVMQQRDKVRILGIMSDVKNPMAVAALDAIDTAYGHSGIPLGTVADSAANTAPHGYSDVLASRLRHSVHSSADVPAAVTLYRRLLAAQPDHSVTIVSLGGYSNLAGLLASKPGPSSSLDGRALVAAKVKQLVIEDGLFPNGGPAFTNFNIDPESARAVIGGAGWPTPVAWVDGFTGIETKVGASLCTTTPSGNPMRIVYETLFGCGQPKDGDWDGPTMLYAIGGAQGIFSELGRGGAAVLDAQGGLGWETHAGRSDEIYVHVLDQQGLNNRIDALLAMG
jgi:Inosine-uridine preferring nucleoside hydrolase